MSKDIIVNGVHFHGFDCGDDHCRVCVQFRGEEPNRETGLRDLITDLPDESGYDYWGTCDGWVPGWEGED